MITLLAAVFYVILMETIRYYLLRLYNKPILKHEGEWPQVSVVVPFRNEEGNIRRIADELLKQSYPGSPPDIIFVNDHSTDNSVSRIPPGVICLQLEAGETGKKSALTRGILAAKGEWIITTDADVTIPFGWIRSLMRAGLSGNGKMVCGQVEVSSDGSWSDDFQRMETFILQGTGQAMLDAGKPFLNTGACLAFRKDAWTEAGGYAENISIQSGDDVFLMFEFARKFPGSVVASPESKVITAPLQGFSAILRQRIRWVSKITAYRSLLVFLVAFLVTGSAFTWLFSLFCGEWTVAVLSILLRGFGELRLLHAASAGHRPAGTGSQILMVFLYPFFLLILTVASIFFKPRWKGR